MVNDRQPSRVFVMSHSMGSTIVGEMLQLAMALETRNLQLQFVPITDRKCLFQHLHWARVNNV